MIRKFALVAALSILGATPVLAQGGHGAPSQGASDQHKALIGVWVGTFSTDHAPPGGYKLTIARDTAWKVTANVTFNEEAMPTVVTNFKANGSKLTWNQELMGGNCEGTALLEKDTIKGAVNCGPGNITLSLVKK